MKVAIYTRVSSEDQAERGTIENQVEFAHKYCDLHQLDIFKLYKEDGISGTIALEQRPEGMQLIEDAKNKRFDTLLIYKLDRLGRSARITLNSIHMLEELGIQIKSMTEPFDTSSPNGRFMITMLAGVADLERETILERMWHGANRAAREGKWLGGITPFGYYVNDNGYLAINEGALPGFNMSEVDVVRLVYDLIGNQGYSTVKVADYLNALGVPPAYIKDNRQLSKGKRKETTSGVWRPARIGSLVKNSVYMGIHKYGKRSNKQRELIPREVPAIISPELWEKTMQQLKINLKDSFRNKKRDYLLSGLIKCACCGLVYVGKVFHGEKRELKSFYVCGGKVKYNGPLLGKCKSKNVPAVWIEEMVWDDVLHFINNPGDVLNKLDDSADDMKALQISLTKEKNMLQGVLSDKQSEKQSILDLYRRKIISMDDVERQIEKISYEILSVESRIEELKIKLSSAASTENKRSAVEEKLSIIREKIKDNLEFKEKREIVKLLVQEVKVTTIPGPTEKSRSKAEIDIIFNV